MKPTTPDALVRRYLRQLRAELAPLPADRRQEVLDQIGEHIAVRRSEPDGQALVEVRAMLDRLGDPATLGADARERFGVRPRRRGPVETLVLVCAVAGPFLVLVPAVLLPFGSVRPWHVVPVAVAALLWLSRLWRVRDKVVGTALLLGCAAVFVLLDLLGFQDTGLGSLALLLVALFVPFGAATCYLAIRMYRLGAAVPPNLGTR
ncbi:HAAS signaling domain-containing protein [Plantactinospora sp. KLBMP9567]|uniref:HAAS signaling domain-containing protein n=1 Tax=Plantactinospora sp. KLBMP9567 TaxID=3085900 RepID=UPI00298164A8|nr:hypothetical protein [Plantactinospora sp. KLBMP9567]MDW5328656.1 hypothetical protein [Plantactinospora sp. KLBMP9567]